MALLTDVGAYLDAQVSAASLTAGTNLFYGRLPEVPDTCVALYETGGGVPDDTMGNNSAPVFENPRAVQSPFALERDSQDRMVMACNFQIIKTP